MNSISRQVGAGKTFLSPTDFYVEVNTNGGGEVEIVLPNITSLLANINTSIYQYIGIRFVDSSSNASVNNILITAFDNQTINGETQIRLNTNGIGGLLTLIGDKEWSFNANAMLSSGVSEYKTAQLPQESFYPSYRIAENWGYFYDNPPAFLYINTQPVKLNNGNLASAYFMSILYDGTIIYGADDMYDLESPVRGYWIAFQVNPLDSSELIKVAELPMTQQLWGNWYDYTYKDPAITNEVKFVTYTTPSLTSNSVESWITTLTYADGVLTATDTYFDFGGVDFATLFFNLSGSVSESGFTYWNPTGIADDDYAGMGYGSQAGWVYFVPQTELEGIYGWNSLCSYNVLTGETRIIDAIASLIATTNLNINPFYLPSNVVQLINPYDVYAHSQGILLFVYDGYLADNGNNTLGVTAMWSPYWTNNKEVSFINTREGDNVSFSATSYYLPKANWYWDGFNLYVFYVPENQSSFTRNSLGIWTFEMNSQNSRFIELPLLTEYNNLGNNSWAFDDGCLLYLYDNELIFPTSFSKLSYYYCKAGEIRPFVLQNNNFYPTNMIGNTSYSAESSLNYNGLRLGLEYDVYSDISFTK